MKPFRIILVSSKKPAKESNRHQEEKKQVCIAEANFICAYFRIRATTANDMTLAVDLLHYCTVPYDNAQQPPQFLSLSFQSKIQYIQIAPAGYELPP
jgi:hypothetical protein